MKVCFTSDIHGNRLFIKKLFHFVREREIFHIVLGGDILPTINDFDPESDVQKTFILGFLAGFLLKFYKTSGKRNFYFIPGNNDLLASMKYFDFLEKKGLLINIDRKIIELTNKYKLIGYPFVPPTNFSFKDYEKKDKIEDELKTQRLLAFVSKNDKLERTDLDEHFKNRNTIEDDLKDIVKQANPEQTIYVMHSPPFGAKLDVIYNERNVGSRAIYEFIEKYQPLLTLHGHIHESYKMTGEYFTRIGKTISINPGRSKNQIHVVIFDPENIEKSIEFIRL